MSTTRNKKIDSFSTPSPSPLLLTFFPFSFSRGVFFQRRLFYLDRNAGALSGLARFLSVIYEFNEYVAIRRVEYEER